MNDRDEVAKTLARLHQEMDSGITRIVRLVSGAPQDEGREQEPLKFLEVNRDTPPVGVMPIWFGPHPPDVPYPCVIIEVTEGEFDAIAKDPGSLPSGWVMADQLYPEKAA